MIDFPTTWVSVASDDPDILRSRKEQGRVRARTSWPMQLMTRHHVSLKYCISSGDVTALTSKANGTKLCLSLKLLLNSSCFFQEKE